MNNVMSVLSNGLVTHAAVGVAGWLGHAWYINKSVLSNAVNQLKADVAQLKTPKA